MNELHHAGRDGSVERTIAVLSRGVIDIDQGDDQMGYTPLMFAAFYGHNQVVRVLLNKGASMSVVNGGGLTALHLAALQGHLAVTKRLVKAGADLEAKSSAVAGGFTPLHLAAEKGHSEVIGVLIEAGANPNSRTVTEVTPLYMASSGGHVDAIKVLLRAKADPLLTASDTSGDDTLLPLDVAASKGHLEVVHELIHECGIEGCGGASNGVQALEAAAEAQHVEVMSVLTGAGVVDTGIALRTASAPGRESSVKFLLQQWKRNSSSGEIPGYLETPNSFGATPMLCSILACRPCSPRITRLLVDAGADTTAAVRLHDERGEVLFDDTPLAFTNLNIRERKIKREDATEEQLHSLEATRRFLMRVEAVHAVSWLWVCDTSSVTDATAKVRNKTKATPTRLISMLPILRRRVQRPRVLLAALSRHSGKPY